MALSYNTLSALPRLRSYADAAAHEARVKPIRGDKDKCKPVGKRNQKWYNIKRLGDGTITINQGDNPLLHYLPNGDLHITPRWTSASTNEIITEITGMQTWTERGMWIRHAAGTAKLRVGRYNYKIANYEPAEPNVFTPSGRPYDPWVAANPQQLVTHVVNRKGANAVRARYAEAIKYIISIAKLRRDNHPTDEERVEALIDMVPEDERVRVRTTQWYLNAYCPAPGDNWRFRKEHALKLAELMRSDNLGDHYKAYLWIEQGGPIKENINYCLMLAHPDEWLEKRLVPDGEKAIDRYAKVFNT